MLKLPKGILTHPNVAGIDARFNANLRLLFNKGRLQVPQWSFDEALQRALQKTYDSKQLIQGLEAIESHLDAELKGLKALQSQPGQNQKQRLSRLLILSNDGSERFYHSAESLLIRHGDRALGCIVDATSEQLGLSFTKKSNPTKALLIHERKALEGFLSALAENGVAQ